MKAAAVALSILIASIMGQPSAQANQSGNEIREVCQISSRGPKTELEVAKATYWEGFVEAILSVGQRLHEPDRFCVPDGVTGGQATNLLLKYLNDNPDKAHRPAETLAITAFWKAWACK